MGTLLVERTTQTHSKSIEIDDQNVASLGILEAEILRLLWDAGEPQTSVQVYEAMRLTRRTEQQEMQSPSTIAVTLSRMVQKGWLTVARSSREGRGSYGKGYYAPVLSRAQVVAAVLDDTSRRLTGQSLGYLLAQLRASQSKRGKASKAVDPARLEAVIEALKRLQHPEEPPSPQQQEP